MLQTAVLLETTLDGLFLSFNRVLTANAPLDALKPKAYCTNPGLSSFLLAPPGVSTRDPSSEMAGNLGRKLRLPRIHLQVLLHASNMRHGTNGFISFPKEGVLRIFSPWKIQRLRPGLNPRTLVPNASTLPLNYRSRSGWNLVSWISIYVIVVCVTIAPIFIILRFT